MALSNLRNLRSSHEEMKTRIGQASAGLTRLKLICKTNIICTAAEIKVFNRLVLAKLF